jgi:5-methyltetrahydrofolate--homocysteine methyltransferase
MDILESLAAALQEGDDQRTSALTAAALAAGLPAGRVLQEGLVAGMKEVGEKFRRREIFLPEVLLSARAMYTGLHHLEPHLAKEGVPPRGKVVLGTVKGDLHDIGKNLVGILLKGAGFEVIDLGHDVPAERFVDAALREGAGVIGMSALLTTTMPRMREVVELVKARGLEGRLRTLVGGAPVTAEFARDIGADGYACDAAAAVDKVKSMLGAS